MDLDNLRAVTTRSHSQNLGDSQTMAKLFRVIYEFPKPTIAAVNGAAMGGGCGAIQLSGTNNQNDLSYGSGVALVAWTAGGVLSR